MLQIRIEQQSPDGSPKFTPPRNYNFKGKEIVSKKSIKNYLDDLYRRCIMIKWGNRCLAEADRNSKRCGGKIECSHIKPKSRGLIARYYLDNAIPLCHSHHFGVWHKDPIWAYRFISNLLGEKKLDQLEIMSWETSPSFDYSAMELYLKDYLRNHKTIEEKLSNA